MLPVYHDCLSTLPRVCGPDHPLSLGLSVVLCSNHPILFTESEATQQQVDVFNPDLWCGYAASWPEHELRVIFINGFEDGAAISIKRIVELVVHECSHTIDHIFDLASIKHVDTELRAYYLDWLVGKVLNHFSLEPISQPNQ